MRRVSGGWPFLHLCVRVWACAVVVGRYDTATIDFLGSRGQGLIHPESERVTLSLTLNPNLIYPESQRGVCVCVCVCGWVRERVRKCSLRAGFGARLRVRVVMSVENFHS